MLSSLQVVHHSAHITIKKRSLRATYAPIDIRAGNDLTLSLARMFVRAA